MATLNDQLGRNSRINTSGVGVYLLNQVELTAFFKDMWQTDWTEFFQTAFIGDGASSLLSLKYFPGFTKSALDLSDYRCRITMGNRALLNGPEVHVSLQETKVIDLGTIDVPRSYNDFRDYTLCQYKLYFPLVGFVDLNPADVVGGKLHLSVRINLTDGSALAHVRDQHNHLIFEGAFTWGYDVPFMAEPMRDAWTSTLKVATANLPGMSGAGSTPSYSVGSLAPNVNWMGDLTPRIIEYRQEDVTEPALLTALGAPSARVQQVGSFSGYLQAESVYSTGDQPAGMSARSYDEIISLLKDGVYV